MSKRGAGISLIGIAAVLFSVRYVSAAIFGSGVTSWDAETFNAMLSYVGQTPLMLSVVALVSGLGYLVWAEYDERVQRRSAGQSAREL